MLLLLAPCSLLDCSWEEFSKLYGLEAPLCNHNITHKSVNFFFIGLLKPPKSCRDAELRRWLAWAGRGSESSDPEEAGGGFRALGFGVLGFRV